MAVWIGLLRGVNVGGKQLAMADLRAAVEHLGHTGVRTYVQSGNVVFDVAGRTTEARLAAALADELEAVAGWRPGVVLRTRRQLDAVVAANPFAHHDAAPTQLHVVFLAEPDPHALDGIDLDALAPEEAVVVGREVYLHLPGGIGRSALAAQLAKPRRAGARGTARNWRTVSALAALASGRRA